jgi:hypothetical protein
MSSNCDVKFSIRYEKEFEKMTVNRLSFAVEPSSGKLFLKDRV